MKGVFKPIKFFHVGIDYSCCDISTPTMDSPLISEQLAESDSIVVSSYCHEYIPLTVRLDIGLSYSLTCLSTLTLDDLIAKIQTHFWYILSISNPQVLGRFAELAKTSAGGRSFKAVSNAKFATG